MCGRLRMAIARISADIFAKTLCRVPLWQTSSPGVNARYFTKSYAPRKGNVWFISLMGIGAGAFVGAGYGYHQYKDSQKPVLNTQGYETILTEIPNVTVSRKMVYQTDTSGLQLKLFQYATCPFCCKVRAFLDYYGLSYDIIEVNPVMRQQIKWSYYKKVPIVIAEHKDTCQQLNDSSMIISALTSYLLDRSESLSDIINYYPAISFKENGYEKTEILNRYFIMCQEKNPDEKTKEAMKVERKWRKWVDDTFVHVLSPNVYRTRAEALQTFHWFSEAGEWEKHFPSWERIIIVYVGAYAMWLISKRLKKRHNLRDDVRLSFYDECNVWLKALDSQGTQFMGGATPNLADLSMYGVLSSIEGSQAFKDVLHNTKLGAWYNSVQSQVRNHKGSEVFER